MTGLLAILMSTTIAIDNYYNDEAFGKSDLRGLIQLIEMRAGSNDVIVYNDAVLLPSHEHYQKRTDIAFTASPIYRTIAEQTSATQLSELAKTYDRIWFIPGKPADKRDELGIAQDWLDTNLMPSDYLFISTEAGLVQTKLYSTMPQTAVSDTPPLVQWPNWPTLSGYNLQSEEPITLPVIWFNLLWESAQKPASNMGLQFQLQDQNGRIWAEHTTPIIQANRNWSATEPNQQSYHLPLNVGTPPGNYTLHAQPVQINNSGGTPLQEAIVLDTIAIAANTTWPNQPIWAKQASRISFVNNFALQKTIFPDQSVRPGHNLPLTLYWQTNEVQTGLRYELTVQDRNGDILRTQSGKPGADWLEKWSANTLFRENTGLYFPPQTEPGIYSLHLQFFQDETLVPGRPYWQPWSSESNKISKITVEPWPLETELPVNAVPVNAEFGEAIELHSYQLQQNEDALDLVLYWQATAVPEKNLFTFVHLTDETGNIIAQIDFVPVSGLRPTAGWRVGEVITDPYALALPADLPAGEYQLAVGLFDPETFERPFVIQQGQEQPDNQIVLTQITLPEKP